MSLMAAKAVGKAIEKIVDLATNPGKDPAETLSGIVTGPAQDLIKETLAQHTKGLDALKLPKVV